jgi:hypothetical protein
VLRQGLFLFLALLFARLALFHAGGVARLLLGRVFLVVGHVLWMRVGGVLRFDACSRLLAAIAHSWQALQNRAKLTSRLDAQRVDLLSASKIPLVMSTTERTLQSDVGTALAS